MTFEERLLKKADTAELKQFRDLCQSVFGTVHGRELLSKLCGARHPLDHNQNLTQHEHGQAEVVATLWRFGAIDPRPPEPKP